MYPYIAFGCRVIVGLRKSFLAVVRNSALQDTNLNRGQYGGHVVVPVLYMYKSESRADYLNRERF